jgi:nucleoside-diphosphate-sugar epimerase
VPRPPVRAIAPCEFSEQKEDESVRVPVTGGAGIGSHLVERLLARGDGVVVLDSVEAQIHVDAKLEGH